ncbi:MAG TPA: hypothetical protein VIM65_16005 [Cyclobacteriaceae bacterium]
MILSSSRIVFTGLSCLLLTFSNECRSQEVKPGLDGMAPSKWITLKNTQAPGRVYSFGNGTYKTATHEDIFVKAWLPLVHTSKCSFIIGPQYRTEQVELQKNDKDNLIRSLSNWSLRSVGVDIRSINRIDSAAWILINANINQSGSRADGSFTNSPLNYTFSAAYLKKRSATNEIGVGVLAGKGFNSITVLPVFIYHNNYSKKAGLEISLPYKIAWRYNVTPSDIVYFKTEALTRNYYIKRIDTDGYATFRKLDVDIGVVYNRKITKLVGVELFGGYRKNISSKLPPGVTGIKTSGIAFSFEVYIRPPGR